MSINTESSPVMTDQTQTQQYPQQQSAAQVQEALTESGEKLIAQQKDDVKKRIKDLENKLTTRMDKLNNDYKETDNEIEKERITEEMEEQRSEIFGQLQEIQNQLDKKEGPPLPVRAVTNAYDFVVLKIKDFIGKMEVDAQVTGGQLNALKAIEAEIERLKNQSVNDGQPINAKDMQELVTLLVSTSKLVAPPPSNNNDNSSNTGPVTPNVDVGKLVQQATAKLNPAEVAAGGGQKGGGISRKPSHPKYMNEISENRNKIFKKELEIINSIRHFHRSHTIRKRDRINNILGLRKSRNNRNNRNNRNCYHGNTKRHQHRHNKHKHKSAKHIKK